MDLDLETHKHDEHVVLAFYGISPTRGSMPMVFDKALEWMGRFGCSPNLMGSTLHNGYLRFRTSEKKARNNKFTNVEYFEVVSLEEGARNDSEGTICTICYRIKTQRRFGFLIVDFKADLIHGRYAEFLEVAKEACSLIKPDYGIGYFRMFGWGPLHYAMGIADGDIPDEEGDRITQWLEAVRYDLYDKGLIRDVYPWNFLTLPQLNAKVRDLRLEDWIRQDPRRGTLSPFTDRVKLWEVKDQDIPKVRQVLFDANIIYDYEKHNRAPLEMFNHTCESEEEAREFFHAWIDKTPEEMKQWYKKKYGREKSAAKPLTGEQVLQKVLQGMGASAENVQVLKVEKPGQVREMSTEEVEKIIRKPRKRPRQ